MTDITVQKFRFRKFRIYIDCREFRKKIKAWSKQAFPPEENFCLRAQLWRALDSIILNIAEGSDRGTDRDFAHFLNNAHTSLNEVVACLDLALDDGYVIKEIHTEFIREAESLANQITAFRKRLTESPMK